MTFEEFREHMQRGKPFEVNVRGWVVGASSKSGLDTDSRGLYAKFTSSRMTVCADVKVDGAEVQNFDTTLTGTTLRLERHGGGTLRVPIELLMAAVAQPSQPEAEG